MTEKPNLWVVLVPGCGRYFVDQVLPYSSEAEALEFIRGFTYSEGFEPEIVEYAAVMKEG